MLFFWLPLTLTPPPLPHRPGPRSPIHEHAQGTLKFSFIGGRRGDSFEGLLCGGILQVRPIPLQKAKNETTKVGLYEVTGGLAKKTELEGKIP